MKKMLFCINPNAGHSGIRTHLLSALEIFCASGFEVRVHTTSGPREITRLIAAEGENYDLIVTAGGDGTLNETTAGLMQLEHPPVLGYIPAGTVNDVAASLHLSMDTLEAARTVVYGEPMPLDIGALNGRPYTYVAGFGAFTEVSYATPQDAKKALGRLAYLLAGVKSLGEIKPIHARVRAEGIEDEDDFLLGLICSTKSVGGFRADNIRSLDISLNDGLSEVLFVRDIKNLVDLNDTIACLLRMDLSDQSRFLSFQTSRVQVDFDTDVPWTVDGEDAGPCRSAEIVNHHAAIRILVPRS